MGTKMQVRRVKEMEYSNGLSLGRIAKSGGKQHDDRSSFRRLVYQALMYRPSWAISILRTSAATPKVMQIISRLPFQLDLVNRREKPLYEAFSGSGDTLPADQSRVQNGVILEFFRLL
jgi:hypothetical protein